jgi:sugar lactone lactonase YvrE
MDGFGFPSSASAVGGGLIKVNLATSTVNRYDQHCGYGITVDQDGYVWTGGKQWWSDAVPDHSSCVQRFNSKNDTIADTGYQPAPALFQGVQLRGIAAGAGISAGYVWAAESLGKLYRIKADTLTDVTTYNTPVVGTGVVCHDKTPTGGDYCDNGLVGVAVDHVGYVWVISTTENAAYKFDPRSEEFTKVPVGQLPYTYSDMTGMQLRNVIRVN